MGDSGARALGDGGAGGSVGRPVMGVELSASGRGGLVAMTADEGAAVRLEAAGCRRPLLHPASRATDSASVAAIRKDCAALDV